MFGSGAAWSMPLKESAKTAGESRGRMSSSVTAVSGSGPAYVFYFIEAVRQAALEVIVALAQEIQLQLIAADRFLSALLALGLFLAAAALAGLLVVALGAHVLDDVLTLELLLHAAQRTVDRLILTHFDLDGHGEREGVVC